MNNDKFLSEINEYPWVNTSLMENVRFSTSCKKLSNAQKIEEEKEVSRLDSQEFAI